MLRSMRSKARDAGEALMLELILTRTEGGLEALLPALARTGVAICLKPSAASARACGDSTGSTGAAAIPNSPGNYKESSKLPVTEDDEQSSPYSGRRHVWRGDVEVRHRLKIIPSKTPSSVSPQDVGTSGSPPVGVKSEDGDISLDSSDDLTMSASGSTLEVNIGVDESFATRKIREASAVKRLPPSQQSRKGVFPLVSDETGEMSSEKTKTPKREKVAETSVSGAGHGVVKNGGEDDQLGKTPDIDRKNGRPTLVAGGDQKGQQYPLYKPVGEPVAAATAAPAKGAHGKGKPEKRSGWWISKLFSFGKDENN